MKYHILYQAKAKKNIFAQAEKIYTDRINRYCKLELQPINPLKLSASLSVDQIRSKEEEHFEKFIKPGTYRILMDEKGAEFSSLSFSKYLEKLQISGPKDIVFIIGGAYGFSDNFKATADGIISLSKLTFAHHLARIVFLEQLYRAFTILGGEPYHNA